MEMMRSLEDYRRERLLDIRAFADHLGIAVDTYRRLLREPERVRMRTKRQVLARLGVASPYLVAELVPLPSQILLQQVQAAYEEGDHLGWAAYDPETLEPTGERFDADGRLM
jgi:hypothetical protein